ncbi:hypothetical protein CLV24_108165 [Pontibacter ummariensis]|uniref:Uncharacterized protein n=1 Tax=Pontibacter ummariensis TaxID=1610492 RepID=A0A239F6X0_9BACT|nr:Ig-like domain-containing protein [Pontibacter ummariensis]PRY12421.1 hypothetical protein CLV24_108165 [Pontibacter ummariensis]SNS52043.1 hypothetical protein SAMN06296052_10820 [Pontibacter ummariensis]
MFQKHYDGILQVQKQPETKKSIFIPVFRATLSHLPLSYPQKQKDNLMRKHITVRQAFFLALASAALALWGCEQVEEDVAPVSFTNFKLNDDLLYVYNDQDSRVWSAVNDTVEVYEKITYSQPVHGEIYPNYANDSEKIMGYKPKPGYVGLDSLTYEVCNGGTCKTAKIKLVVDNRPDFTNCTFQLGADSIITTVNKPSKGVRLFLNDSICKGTYNFGTKYWHPENGVIKTVDYFEGEKNILYVYYPNKNFRGEDSFTYRVYPNGWDGENANYYQEVKVKIVVK